MEDLEAQLIFGETYSEFARSLTRVTRSLPEEPRERLRKISKHYMARYGLDNYQYLNNKTVAQIFEEYSPDESKLVADGELDGYRYRLYRQESEEDIK